MELLARIAGLADASTRGLGRLLAIASALSVAAIVAILVFSAVQRYALERPIPATEELAGYLFVAVAFLSLTEGFTEGRQIRILPLWRRLPGRLQGWAMAVGHLGSLVVLAVLIRQTFDFAWASYQFGARSYVANLLEWPWMMILPFALFVLALAVAARFVVDLERTLRGVPVREAEDNGAEEGI
ncbi:TRAP transporter small permease [Microbaculum marinum]|uniref:TRAP transporter small permease protein n=1 Tax=Microbaculum marinum TaxID=1764581 RepID=A0AAW9RZ05_9HYPH